MGHPPGEVGHPPVKVDMDENSPHLHRALGRLAYAAALFTTVTILILGLHALRYPSAAQEGSVSANHPLLFGISFTTVASVIIVWTASHWIKVLPGLIAYAIIGGLAAVASGGFHSRIASRSLTLSETSLLVVLFALELGLSITFSKRSLSMVDRIALLIFVWSLAFSTIGAAREMFESLLAGTASLLIAAAIHRFTRSARSSARRVIRKCGRPRISATGGWPMSRPLTNWGAPCLAVFETWALPTHGTNRCVCD
jgi:hypothetical protein